jgi:transposase
LLWREGKQLGVARVCARVFQIVQDAVRGPALRIEHQTAIAALHEKRIENAQLIGAHDRAQAQLTKLEGEIAQLKKHLFGPKSEKIPTPWAELRKVDGEKADPAETQRKRLENALLRESIPARQIMHPVRNPSRTCPRCLIEMTSVGFIECAPIIEYAQDGFVREEHALEKIVCPSCALTTVAVEPPRVLEGGRYGAGLMAYLIVAKCGDSIPIYRLEKSFRRLGIHMARSTMNELLHAAARELEPIYKRLMKLIRESRIVRADETPMRVQKRKKRGFVWTFISEIERADEPAWLIGYRFSPDRSGATPKEVLGGTDGYLLVDGYSGYNAVLDVDGRVRACCNAHARRKFHEALENAPVAARKALDFYLEIYRVEREAKLVGIVGTKAHLELRQTRSKSVMAAFKEWLEKEKPLHLPKGPMGSAISYALNHWDELTRFLEDAKLAVDNNASESALRVIALGRKNFLHFGHDHAGQNIAMLYSLVSTCEANHINPIEYLKDVLLRLRTHPASKIDELLPHLWRRRSDDGDGGPSNSGSEPPEGPTPEGPGRDGYVPPTESHSSPDVVSTNIPDRPEYSTADAPVALDADAASPSHSFSAHVAQRALVHRRCHPTGTASKAGASHRPKQRSCPKERRRPTRAWPTRSRDSPRTRMRRVGAKSAGANGWKILTQRFPHARGEN